MSVKDGRIISQGTVSDALAKDKRLAKQVENEIVEEATEEVEKDPEAGSTEKPAEGAGKLIVEEEVPVGHVTWAASMLNYDSSLLYSDYLVSEIVPGGRDGGEGSSIAVLGCFPLNSRTEENPRQP